MINRKVKGYRLMLGMTQTDLSKILKITPQSVSNKERGITSFTDREKIEIRNLIRKINPNITIDELFY